MKVSAKVDYACRALLALGLHWPQMQPLQVQDVARRQKIPMNFLVHILITLKQMGYVDSVRGKSGGYRLIKSPREILMSDVIRSFGGLGLSETSPRKSKNVHVLDAFWQEIDQAIFNAVKDFTLEELCNREHKRSSAVMFDI